MQDVPSDHFAVSAVLLKRPSQNRWVDASWTLLGLLPGLVREQLQTAEADGELLTLPDLHLQLFRQHCDAYYHNLMSGSPKVYLVCQREAAELRPLLLTVDFDEAASYMETDEQVFDAPLPDELCVWLERFVLRYYTPQKPKKRKRQQWHDADDEPSYDH